MPSDSEITKNLHFFVNFNEVALEKLFSFLNIQNIFCYQQKHVLDAKLFKKSRFSH